MQCLCKLKQSALYFPYEQLEFKEELGSGAFGVVRKAIAHNIEPEGLSTTVAVKSLKGGSFLYTMMKAFSKQTNPQ